jgi:hypothetical protein
MFPLGSLAMGILWREIIEAVTTGGFHKSWARGVKLRADPKLGEHKISQAQGTNADAKF